MFRSTLSFLYERHTPETTLLYQLAERHWPEFKAILCSQGKQLPGYVTREFDDFLKCGRLEYGFLRVRCDICHHEKLVAFTKAYVSAVKAMVPGVVCEIIDAAIQMHGATGISQWTPLATMYTDMRHLRFADGPDEVHHMLVGRAELQKYDLW